MVQLAIAVAGLVAAFVAVVVNATSGTAAITAEGAVAIDGPTLFMQGTVLLLSLGAVLLMAERSIDPSGDAFAPTASAVPGSDDEREAATGWAGGRPRSARSPCSRSAACCCSRRPTTC